MRQRVANWKVEKAREFFDAGFGYVAIGKEMGISPEWVRQLLKRSPGWAPRHRGTVLGSKGAGHLPQAEPAQVE